MDNFIPPQAEALHSLNDAILRMNSAISKAVDAGVSVEVARSFRYHDGQGNWGDQIMLSFHDKK